jgi:hypothetical protein
MQKLPRYGTSNHQLGLSLLPALVTVALLTITIIWVEIPQQMHQQQTNQATAHTNTSVQLLGASLKFYDENNRWPDKLNLETDLAPYLPIIQPADSILAGITITTMADDGDKAKIIIEAQTHAKALARQLARQFGQGNVDIINAAGEPASDGDRVKVELYPYKNGSSYYLAINNSIDNFGGTIYERATKENGYVSLTTNVNSINGQLQFDNIHSGNRIYATFQTWIGGGSGADALYFYWAATARPWMEEIDSRGYNFAIDTYSNQLQLRAADKLIYTKSMYNLDDSQWHSWTVEMKEGVVSVWRDNNLQFTRENSLTISNSTFIGWGARTGGLNNHHRVRNMKVWISSNDGTVTDDL